jgi:predicted CXXCH cytochrome family protein
MRRHFAKEVSQEVRIKTIGKVGFVVLLIGLVLFSLGGVAFATTGQNGPTPPALGDPVGSDQSPHGGFSVSTDFCLQCHSVHNTANTTDGQYALLWKASVQATCNTCHAIPGIFGAASGPRDSDTLTGFTAGIMGTASSRSAYDNAAPAATHPLGATDTDGTGDQVAMQTSGWSYRGSPASWAAANQQTPDGLQCTSCHTAHGNWGALINSERGVVRTTAGGASLDNPQTFAEGRAVYIGRNVKYLHLGGTGWQYCDDAGGTTNCVALTTTDSEGQTVYLYGYKLLSAYPNFNWDGGGESWGLDASAHDQARWCGTCHPRHVSNDFGAAFTYHNHPTGCTACHGNPANDATSADFPHTSTFGNFLKKYPDGLCIDCHTAGALP